MASPSGCIVETSRMSLINVNKEFAETRRSRSEYVVACLNQIRPIIRPALLRRSLVFDHVSKKLILHGGGSF